MSNTNTVYHPEEKKGVMGAVEISSARFEGLKFQKYPMWANHAQLPFAPLGE
jgi:hypothetical protein